MNEKLYCIPIGKNGMELLVRANSLEEAKVKLKDDYRKYFGVEIDVSECHEVTK